MKVYETMATSVDIKDIQGNIILSTPINEGSKRKFTLQKEDYVTLKFSLDDPIYFKLGNWVDTDFGLFELVDLYKPNYNQSTAGYDYELRLDAYYWKWKNKKLKYSPESAAKETSFSLTATLDVHAGIVLRNLSALGYKYRGVDFTFSIDSTVENKPFLMTYDNINILDACFQMASSAGCECWVTDNIIHFGRCEFGDPVDFELGVNVDTMKRSDSQTEYSTRIIAFGSTRNIPTNYRPTDDSMIVGGVVQKRLMLPVGTSYVDAYENMTEEEAVEDIVVFDDIYPRRVGTMSGVTTKQYTDKTENEDGTATSEVWNAYRFKDSINFSKDYVISGQDLKIKFESGLLNGLEFGVTFNPDGKPEKKDNAWNPEAQVWEIVRSSDYGIDLPNDTLKPVNGDTFVLSGFDTAFVSDQYLPAAEQELKERTEAYVAKTKIDPSTYDNKMMSGGTLYEAGDRVNLINPGYFENGRLSRIIGFEYNLDIPTDSPIYTVGETAAYSRIGDIEEKLETITYKSQTYTGTGGSGIYIIRTNDSTIASNNNVMSALRTINEILQRSISKTNPDTAAKVITFIEGLISQGLIEAKGGIRLPSGAALYSAYVDGTLAFAMDENGFVIYERGTANKWSVITSAGAEFQNLVIKFLAQITDLEVSNKATTLDLVVQALAKTYNLTVDNTADLMHGIIREYLTSESFVSGFLGSGFKIWKDANGDWNGEFDKLTVRKIFTIFELVVQKVVHQGGMVIRSAAGGKLVKVTDGGTYWKCEHDSTDDFLLDDQVLCQTFTGTSIKRYWRKVTSAGAGYFNLSKTDCEAGSANPEVGDNVAVLGNRTNTDRQSAQIDCAVGVNAPYRDDYAGINSYSLVGKLINRTGNLSGITDPDFGVLSGSGLIGMNAYLKGVFRLKSSGKLVEDAISDAQSESNAYTDGKITTVETNFEIREGQISSKVTQAITAATQASGYATSAQGSASTATTKATAASNSATAAAGSATTAGQKAADAADSATAAQDAADDAATILSQVTTKESSINQTASNITLQVSEVTTKVTTATSKASEAATSASNAKTSETNASGSASTASSKASAAATSATNAANSATAAAGSATTAANILTEVTEKKSSIDQTADSITLKVSEVNTKTAQAVTSATNAANSATTASTAAGTATTKATEAANSASTATTKATAASGSASAAATSATNAATSAANAANILTSVTTKQSEINQTAGNITLQVTEVTTKTVQATNAAELATAMSKGKMLYRDPTFESGYNGTNQYLGNATRTIQTVAGCPNPLAKAMIITATGWNTSSDIRIAGFNFSNLSRANAIFIVRIVALIPVGRSINNYHNAYGTGGTTQWLTSQAGTGAWTEYVCKVICGSSGTFSTINHFALVGGAAPTASSPVSWYVAYASVWDVTAVDDVPTRTEASSDAQTKANTAESNAKNYANSTFTTKTEFSSQLSVLNNSISAKVSQTDFNSLSTRVSSAEQKITPDAIILTVSSTITTAKNEAINAAATDATTKANNAKSGAVSEIVSSFNITSGGITIGSKTIALTGLITFSSLASDAQTKITSAQSTANQALGSISNLSADIGAMAYYDNVSLAKLDSTIVEGGYIKTSLIDANAIITGSLLAAKIAATNITTTRLTVSEGCTVGGFSIGSNRIGISATPDNVGSDGMFLYSSMIGFNAGSRQAIIGTYNTLGTSRLGQFIDTTSNYLPNVGIAFDIRSTNNGNRNYAFLGNGNGVLNGFVSGYGFREYSFAANNQYSVVGTLTSEFILVYFNYSNCAIVLPTLASMCDTLGISYTKAFTVRLTVISTAGNSGKLYGRSSSGISGISGYNYPELRDWNNAINNGGFGIDQGDSYELCMFYDGSSTSSVPSRSDAYRAYIINRQN